MKIIVDKLLENPKDCVFSRITTGTRRCAHNAKICPLTNGAECSFLMVAEAPSISAMMNPISEPAVEPEKPKSKRTKAKRAE